MVDVSHKPALFREAVAAGEIRLAAATLDLIEANHIAKGNVLATARLAGIMAAKRTGELIPLCHPLALSKIAVDFEVLADRVAIRCEVALSGRTGVEMEALTGVSVAALTLYDMLKAVDKAMVVSNIRVTSKEKATPAP